MLKNIASQWVHELKACLALSFKSNQNVCVTLPLQFYSPHSSHIDSFNSLKFASALIHIYICMSDCSCIFV